MSENVGASTACTGINVPLPSKSRSVKHRKESRLVEPCPSRFIFRRFSVRVGAGSLFILTAPGYSLHYATTVSFQIFSNLLFVSHPSIRRYAVSTLTALNNGRKKQKEIKYTTPNVANVT
jgi:hypothetical protein